MTRNTRMRHSRLTLPGLLLLALTTGAASGATIYGTGGNGTQLVAIDTSTGTGTVIGSTGTSATYGTAFSPDGTLFTVVNSFSSSGRLATLDLNTGAATVFGQPVGVPDMMVLEFAPDGTLYTASWASNSLYTMDVGTGAPTLVGPLGFSGIMDFAFDASGTLWAVNSTNLWTIDLQTGAGTHVVSVSGASCLMGLAFDPQDRLFATDYCSSNSPLYEIDPVTGIATVVGVTGISNPHGGDVFFSCGNGVLDGEDECDEGPLNGTTTSCCSATCTLEPAGTTCNDSDACTQTDECDGDGTCIGTNPVVCTAQDQCHDAGTCDPATGICDDPERPGGTPCDDGNACTLDDTCQAGACEPGAPTLLDPLVDPDQTLQCVEQTVTETLP